MSLQPFLRWVGGKRVLAPQIEALFGGPPPTHAWYIEPFLGGGAVLLHRLSLHPGMKAMGSDTLQPLMDCWNLVALAPAEVAGQLGQLPPAGQPEGWKERYFEIRHAFRYTIGKPNAMQAARFIWLNKASFQGLYRVNKAGVYNTPPGSKVGAIPSVETLQALALALRGVSFIAQDFRTTLDEVSGGDQVYCDPPYVPVGAQGFTDYSGPFGMTEHVALRDAARSCAARGATCIISNADTPWTRELYADASDLHQTAMRRSVNSDGNGRGAVSELLAVYRP